MVYVNNCTDLQSMIINNIIFLPLSKQTNTISVDRVENFLRQNNGDTADFRVNNANVNKVLSTAVQRHDVLSRLIRRGSEVIKLFHAQISRA